MAKIVGVKFKNTAKVYYFAPSDGSYEPGSGVVVETARGMEYGTVAFGVKEVPDEEVVQPLKPIVRKATRRDEENVKRNEERTPEAMKIAAEKIARHGLKMKLVGCEFTFDGKKVVFYFTADGRVDFRELV
ncbi:MAG: stage 0 sporulation protein, partial [Clostridia bacterium]|nr:stage 0 sporulation protein [Clostridia bacterium]